MTTTPVSLAERRRSKAPAADPPRRRLRLSAGWRKTVLLVHIVASVSWLGVTAGFVVLTVALLDVRDPEVARHGYALHEMTVAWLARPAALITLASGVVLSVGTKWRLTRYGWVLAKLALLVATVALTVSVSPELLRYTMEHAESIGQPAYRDAQRTLVLMAGYHVVMIGAAVVLSVYKPGGRLRLWPRRRRAGVRVVGDGG